MRHTLFKIQIGLLVVAAILAVLIPVNNDFQTIFLTWQFLTGFIQLASAAYLVKASHYRQLLGSMLAFYWLAVFVDISLLIMCVIVSKAPAIVGVAAFFVIPWATAIYFAVITYRLPVVKE